MTALRATVEHRVMREELIVAMRQVVAAEQKVIELRKEMDRLRGELAEALKHLSPGGRSFV